MKIVTVIGARPQFVKAAVVSHAFRSISGVEEILVHTGQHYDENMSDVFFGELDIPKPRHQLGVGSGSHGAMTGRMLEKIEQVLVAERPDVVLVYGDTNSTLAAALAAAKMHVPIAHVEAGLRSFNRRMPEEINRVLTDHLSGWLFAPTPAAVANLRAEGIAEERIAEVGDVMYDAALRFAQVVAQRSEGIDRFGVQAGEYVLATIHRAENTDSPERLVGIFSGLRQIAERLPVLLPLHPRTRSILAREKMLGHDTGGLRVIDPVGYLDMVELERSARLIVTDSGGVQKEAFFHRVPCVTLRTETEWVELVEIGWNRLVPPTGVDAIREGILLSLDQESLPTPPTTLYGGGFASRSIVERLCRAA
ncbi:MAG TPA: UDP-N-acetylglucosamine 2-epimerase (non-hydrolyzing) [Gemmataceae bacterium]|jgi:UDP-GlcNAc3NAcA epimerase|nr:UDP-N-acetylglucosamine 2-epimerase (non-hydrolyzing) [Gemmataceae bacterium]